MVMMAASDIHGSAFYCGKMLEAYKKEGAERLLLLGDLLYHGPRNDLPREYDPRKVIAMLNPFKNEICAVRGNCDTEVDQMVLEFPILADYSLIFWEKKRIYATHGHVYNEEHLPPLVKGDVLLHGHTHLYCAKETEGHLILNPGSVSIPKGGNPPTYGIIKDGVFYVKDFEGNVKAKAAL